MVDVREAHDVPKGYQPSTDDAEVTVFVQLERPKALMHKLTLAIRVSFVERIGSTDSKDERLRSSVSTTLAEAREVKLRTSTPTVDPTFIVDELTNLTSLQVVVPSMLAVHVVTISIQWRLLKNAQLKMLVHCFLQWQLKTFCQLEQFSMSQQAKLQMLHHFRKCL